MLCIRHNTFLGRKGNLMYVFGHRLFGDQPKIFHVFKDFRILGILTQKFSFLWDHFAPLTGFLKIWNWQLWLLQIVFKLETRDFVTTGVCGVVVHFRHASLAHRIKLRIMCFLITSRMDHLKLNLYFIYEKKYLLTSKSWRGDMNNIRLLYTLKKELRFLQNKAKLHGKLWKIWNLY